MVKSKIPDFGVFAVLMWMRWNWMRVMLDSEKGNNKMIYIIVKEAKGQS